MTPETKKALRNYGVVLLVFGLMAGAYIYVTLLPKPDEQTLCHPEHPPRNHTIILIDKTDPLPAGAEQKLRELILREKSALAQFDKLSIYHIVEHPVLAVAPVFSLCNPGTRETASPYYENPVMIQAFFEQNFEAPLNDALQDIASVPPGKESPIMEAVQTVASLDQGKENAINRHLIIVSDMLQNVQGKYSHYSHHDDFAAFDRLDYARQVEADLSRTKVSVKYISRYRYRLHQGNWNPAFWHAYFKAAGARSVNVEPFVTIGENG